MRWLMELLGETGLGWECDFLLGAAPPATPCLLSGGSSVSPAACRWLGWGGGARPLCPVPADEGDHLSYST